MAQVNMSFPAVNALPSDSHFALQTNLEQFCPTEHVLHSKAALKCPFTDFDMQSSLNVTSKGLNSAMHSSPAVFSATNAYTTAYDPTTISLLETCFDSDHASLSSDSNYSFDGQMHYVDSSNLATFTDNINLAPKRRCDSLHSNFAAHSPTMPQAQAQVGRRRGSERAESGLARAIHLEKNRKAASKCRSKQKRQQEELVETARDMGRRNKILNVEVELLNGEMQDLMQLLAQHTECPDARLKQYLQREADRIATGRHRDGLPSPVSRSPYSGTSSISEVHRQKEE
jgi:hypothetical protein